MKTLSARYRQAHREAKWAVGLALAYFIWWYISAYAFAPTDAISPLPELYFGFPLWFLLACIIGPVLFTVLCGLMVKFIYQDMSLDVEKDNSHE
ncbi:YhdT family protein [Photobacterium sp.]|uniref:YhdT family protein n=1 Tax=Photobacterium sp. TaxID=660 RepID=UPI00299E0D9D|nr:YhdT family protein [Photobacterium sp.]MDX1304185.1 YhdT family protein [Photobacterium sp.]